MPMIWIEPYYRIRDGVLEQVRGHWRRRKRRRSATVVAFPGTSAA
jgi:hypothetical protein